MKKIGIVTVILFLTVFSGLGAQTVEKAQITVSIEPTNIAPGAEGTLRATFIIPENMYMALQERFFFIDIPDTEIVTLGPLSYPPGEEKNGLTIYKKSVTLERNFTVSTAATEGEKVLTVVAGYQFCDESGTCFMPQKQEHTVQLTVADQEIESAVNGGLENGSTGSVSVFGTILRFILFAFIGGVLLNVMPCVLPLLSVRALSLVNQSQQERKKIFAGSMAYTGGILVSFIILATIVTILKVSGELVGWGFQFQNPGFVIVLISVIFVFALSMFDVFVISAPGMTAAAKASGKGGYLGSFFTGVFAVLVATPCTAPFLGAALGFAFSQPPVIIYMIFIFVGLGLALPFIILGIWPKFIQKIPKPGNWMNIFKEVMGFLLIGTVIYLLTTLYRQLEGGNFLRMLIFLGILAFAAWLYGRFAKPGSSKLKSWIAFFIAAAIVTLGAIYVVKTDSSDEFSTGGGEAVTAQEESFYISEAWEEFSPEKVALYREEGHPVFIDFHAAWCTNCKVNKASVLSKEDILAAFDEYGVKLLHGDYTERDKTIADWIRKFGKAGVPVYALFVPGREDPIVFPELLSKNMIFSSLRDNLTPK